MLNLVTVKARTRGKTPKEFTYEGVGKLELRTVMSGKDEVKKDEKGAPVLDEDGKPKMVQAPLRNEDGSEVQVHDIDASGVTSDLQDVINLFAKVPAKDEKDTPLQRVIDGALNWYNVLARKAASPVVEVVTEDELSPIVAELITAGLLTEDNASVWRRNVTSGAKLIDTDRLDYVKMTKEYKKLVASRASTSAA